MLAREKKHLDRSCNFCLTQTTNAMTLFIPYCKLWNKQLLFSTCILSVYVQIHTFQKNTIELFKFVMLKYLDKIKDGNHLFICSVKIFLSSSQLPWTWSVKLFLTWLKKKKKCWLYFVLCLVVFFYHCL